jgi:hypothetical protein
MPDPGGMLIRRAHTQTMLETQALAVPGEGMTSVKDELNGMTTRRDDNSMG